MAASFDELVERTTTPEVRARAAERTRELLAEIRDLGARCPGEAVGPLGYATTDPEELAARMAALDALTAHAHSTDPTPAG